MPINREELEKRLEQLKVEQAQVQANLVQLQANLNAYLGAIQDCEYWINQLEVQEPDAKKDN
jgi:septal ring factor EnvC (AmiA/AmiB activator)